jgi:hypothetical protein
MKKTLALLFGLSLVMYSSGTAWAQVRGAGHLPEPAHRVDHDDHSKTHDSDVDHNKTHGKADAKEDATERDFVTRIERNPKLYQKLQGLLPTSGTNSNMSNAAMGFPNEGQFIAALHAAKDLGVSFDTFKTTMMSKNPPLSLGQTIHQLKPTLTEKQVDIEADKAEKDAKLDEKIKSTTKPTT